MPKKNYRVSIGTGDGHFQELPDNSLLAEFIYGEPAAEKTIEITGATLKDDFCNYSYEIVKGPLLGPGNFKGSNIMHNDLRMAVKRLNVHLAVICEEIDKENINNISEYENIDFTVEHSEMTVAGHVVKFSVNQFIIDGTGENESVVLVGSKRLTTGDFVGLKSPKTLWLGDYNYIMELRAAIDDIKREVELYMNGKAAPKLVQAEMNFDKENEREGDE